jgi:hypothetical protein
MHDKGHGPARTHRSKKATFIDARPLPTVASMRWVKITLRNSTFGQADSERYRPNFLQR